MSKASEFNWNGGAFLSANLGKSQHLPLQRVFVQKEKKKKKKQRRESGRDDTVVSVTVNGTKMKQRNNASVSAYNRLQPRDSTYFAVIFAFSSKTTCKGKPDRWLVSHAKKSRLALGLRLQRSHTRSNVNISIGKGMPPNLHRRQKRDQGAVFTAGKMLHIGICRRVVEESGSGEDTRWSSGDARKGRG
ncbi:hypothetical protein LXL04_002861 [Taraxacum kok-saghyz]